MNRALRKEIVSVADARRDLSKTLRKFRIDPNAAPIVLGSHRKPEAVLVSYDQFIQGLIPVDRPVSLSEVKSKASLILRAVADANCSEPAIFGSVARGEERLGSNVDMLVSAGPDVSHFDIVDLEADLEQILGARVDVVTRDVLDSRGSDNAKRIASELVTI